MLIIACISLLALMLLGVPITFSLLGAGFLAVLLVDGGLPMYMNCRGFIGNCWICASVSEAVCPSTKESCVLPLWPSQMPPPLELLSPA